MLTLCFVIGITLFAQHGTGNGQGNGQGKNKQNKEQNNIQKDNKKDKEKNNTKETEPQSDKEKEKDKGQGKGHAYGKNKDTLQGRDFGQHRAAEARSKHDAIQESQTNITDITNTNQSTREKIKEARDKLNQKKNNKQITESDYNRNIKELDELEIKLNQLEEKNKSAQEKLNKEKESVK